MQNRQSTSGCYPWCNNIFLVLSSSGGVEVEEKGNDVLANVIGGSGSTSRLVDVCIQKNISFEGKPLTPTSLSLGFSETLSLREQLKQAEERAEQLQRQVCCHRYTGACTWSRKAGGDTLGWIGSEVEETVGWIGPGRYTGVDRPGKVLLGGLARESAVGSINWGMYTGLDWLEQVHQGGQAQEATVGRIGRSRYTVLDRLRKVLWGG